MSVAPKLCRQLSRTGPARLGITLACFLLAAAQISADSGELTAARRLYLEARYEEALSTLSGSSASGVAPDERQQLMFYKFLCLLALNRNDDATRSAAELVQSSPTYRPGQGDTSPSVRQMFQQVRRRELPAIVTREYIAAREHFLAGRLAEARTGFDLVIALTNDADMQGQGADMRLLASGFRDLSLLRPSAVVAPAAAPQPAAAAPAPAPAPAVQQTRAAAPVAASAANSAMSRHYSAKDSEVVPPIILLQQLPPIPSDFRSRLKGSVVIEVMIGQAGEVEHATMKRGVGAPYDNAMVLTAASKWRYKPALRDGLPVPYQKVITFVIDSH